MGTLSYLDRTQGMLGGLVVDRRERYRTDPEYRATVNKANRERYHKNMSNPAKKLRHRILAAINNAMVALEHHEKQAAYYRRRIKKDQEWLASLPKPE